MGVNKSIASYVTKMGITISSISQATGIKYPALVTALHEQRKLSADEYGEICDFLGVPYEMFFTNEG